MKYCTQISFGESLKLLFSNNLLQCRDFYKGSLKFNSILSKFGKVDGLPRNCMVPILFLHVSKFHLFHSKSCGCTNRVDIIGHGTPHSSSTRPRWSPCGVVSIAQGEHSTTALTICSTTEGSCQFNCITSQRSAHHLVFSYASRASLSEVCSRIIIINKICIIVKCASSPKGLHHHYSMHRVRIIIIACIICITIIMESQ